MIDQQDPFAAAAEALLGQGQDPFASAASTLAEANEQDLLDYAKGMGKAFVGSAMNVVGDTATAVSKLGLGNALIPGVSLIPGDPYHAGFDKAAEWLHQNAPQPDPRVSDNLAVQVSGAAGSSVPFIAEAALTSGLGPVASAAATGATSMLTEFGGGFNEAKARGADDPTAMKAGLLTAPFGALDAFPEASQGWKLFKAFKPAAHVVERAGLVGSIERLLTRVEGLPPAASMALSGLAEGAQEIGQGLGENWAQRLAGTIKSDDEAQSLLDVANEQGVPAALSSMLLEAAIGFLHRRGSRRTPPPSNTGASADQEGVALGGVADLGGKSTEAPASTPEEDRTARLIELPEDDVRKAVDKLLSNPSVQPAADKIYPGPQIYQPLDSIKEHAGSVGARVVEVSAPGYQNWEGYYDKESGIIVLNADAGPEAKQRELLKHELTHFMATTQPALYEEYVQALTAVAPELVAARARTREGIERHLAGSKVQGPVMSPSFATEEAAADIRQSMHPMFEELAVLHPQVAAKIATYNPTLLRRIADAFIDFAHKLGLVKTGSTGKLVRELEAELAKTGGRQDAHLGVKRSTQIALKLGELERAMRLEIPVEQPTNLNYVSFKPTMEYPVPDLEAAAAATRPLTRVRVRGNPDADVVPGAPIMTKGERAAIEKAAQAAQKAEADAASMKASEAAKAAEVAALTGKLGEAERVVRSYGRAVPGLLQRTLNIGHQQAKDLLAKLETAGVVGPPDPVNGRRAVLQSPQEAQEARSRADAAQAKKDADDAAKAAQAAKEAAAPRLLPPHVSPTAAGRGRQPSPATEKPIQLPIAKGANQILVGDIVRTTTREGVVHEGVVLEATGWGDRQRMKVEGLRSPIWMRDADIVQRAGRLTEEQKVRRIEAREERNEPIEPRFARPDTAPSSVNALPIVVPSDRLTASTRKPWGKGLEREFLEKELHLSMDIVRASPRHLKKLTAALRQYHQISGKGTGEQVLKELHATIVEQFLWLHDRIPAAVRARAKLWYDGANKMAKEMGTRYGLTLQQAAGIMAVLSPRNDWFNNVTLGERVMFIMHEHGDDVWHSEMTEWWKAYVYAESLPGATTTQEIAKRQKKLERLEKLEGVKLRDMNDEDAAYFVRVWDETHHSKTVPVLTPEGGVLAPGVNKSGSMKSLSWQSWSNIEKAVAIFRNSDTEFVLGQLGDEAKVNNFYNNIVDPNDPRNFATIDTHAVGAALFMALSGTSKEVAQNFGAAGADPITGATGSYAFLLAAYQDAAAQRGLLAREMQSITWEAIRAVFLDENKGKLEGPIRRIWKQVRMGEKSRSVAREEILRLGEGDTGRRPLAWEDADEGQTIASGATTVGKRLPISVRKGSAKKVLDTIELNLTVATELVPSIGKLMVLVEQGDSKAAALVQDVSYNTILSVLKKTGAKISFEPATGLYDKQVEPSIKLRVTYNLRDRDTVLAALAKFAVDFRQQQIHERSFTTDPVGAVFKDGSYVTPVFTWKVKGALSRQQIQTIIDQSKLAGLTFGDGFIEAYHVADQPTDRAGFAEFIRRARTVHGLLRKTSSGVRRGAARLRVYGGGYGAQRGFASIGGPLLASTAARERAERAVDNYLSSKPPVQVSPKGFPLLPMTAGSFSRPRESDPRYAALAQAQRGKPEDAMLKAQQRLGGGVLSVLVEHVGDITHRMSEAVTSASRGYDYVKPKVEKALRYLRNEYGFGREFNENLVNNARYSGVPVEEYKARAFDALDKYADAHRALPAFNSATTTARDAAVALGERNFAVAESLLSELNDNLGSREQWVSYVEEEDSDSEDGLVFARPQTETPEFKAWFGDSKVVDTNGKPLVVYHATDREFNTFDESKTGTNSWQKWGFSFTDSPETAETYQRGYSQRVMPVYLSLQNPMELNARGHNWDDIPDVGSINIAGRAAKRAGHDGLIVRNISDSGVGGSSKTSTVYVAFRPEQIKSATGNSGAFDASNPDIRFARPLPPITNSVLKNITNRWGADNEERQTARISEDEDVRNFQAGVRSAILDRPLMRTQSREAWRKKAEAELRARPAELKEELIAKWRNQQVLEPWEQIAWALMTEKAAKRMYRTMSAEDTLEAMRLETMIEMYRTTQARGMTAYVDSTKRWSTGAEAFNAVVVKARTKTRQKIEALRKLMLEPMPDEIQFARQKELEELLKEEVAVTQQVIAALRKAGLDPDLVTIDYFRDPYIFARAARIAATTKSTKSDVYLEWRVAAMLSFPPTQIANISGNTAHIGYRAVLGRLTSAVGNLAMRDPNAASFGELPHYIGAMLSALPAAGKNWLMAMQTELPALDIQLANRGVEIPFLSTQVDALEAGRQAIPGWIGRLMRFPSTTTLLAFDEFFKTLAYHSEAVSQAYRIAKREGVSGAGLQARIDSLIADPTSELHLKAWHESRVLAFQDTEGSPTLQAIMGLRKGLDKAAKVPLGSVLFPFVRTPYRIFTRGMAIPFSPVVALHHALSGRWTSDPTSEKYDPELRGRDIGATMIGIAVVLGVASMMGDSDDPWITGSTSMNRGQRELDYRTAPPMSFRVGKKWISYARIEPFATSFATIVDTVRAWMSHPDDGNDEKLMTATGGLVQSVSQSLGDKTFLRTFGEIVKMQHDAEQGNLAGSVADFTAGTLFTPMFPNIMRGSMRSMDDYMRVNTSRALDDKGVVQRTAESLPYTVLPIGKLAPPLRYDLWGRPVERPGRAYVERILSPMPIQGETDKVLAADLVIRRWNTLVDAGARQDGKKYLPTAPGYTFRGHHWTDEEYATLCRESGELAERTIRESTVLDYENPSQEDIDAIRDALQDAHAEVRERLIESRKP